MRGGRRSPSTRIVSHDKRRPSPRSRDSLATDNRDNVQLLDPSQALTDDDVSIVVLSASHGGTASQDGGDAGDESLLDSCFLKPTLDSIGGQKLAVSDDRARRAESVRHQGLRKPSARTHSLLPSRSHSPGLLFNPSQPSEDRPPTPHQYVRNAAQPVGNLQRSASASSLSSRLPRWVGERRSDDTEKSVEYSLVPDDAASDSRSLMQLGSKSQLNAGTFRTMKRALQSGVSRRIPLRALSPAVPDSRQTVKKVFRGGVTTDDKKQVTTLSNGAYDDDEEDSLRAADVTSLIHDFYDERSAGDSLVEKPWQEALLPSAPGHGAGTETNEFGWRPSGLVASHVAPMSEEDLVDDDDALPQSLLELLAASSPPLGTATFASDNDETVAMSRLSLAPSPHSFDWSGAAHLGHKSREVRSSGSKLPVPKAGSRPSTSPRNSSRPGTPSLSLIRPPTPSRIPMPAKRIAGAKPANAGDAPKSEAAVPPPHLSDSSIMSAVAVGDHHVRDAWGRAGEAGGEELQAEGRADIVGKTTNATSDASQRAELPIADSVQGSKDWLYYETGNNVAHTGNSDTDRQVSWPSSAKNTLRAESSTVTTRAGATSEARGSHPKYGSVPPQSTTSSMGRKQSPASSAAKLADGSKVASKPASSASQTRVSSQQKKLPGYAQGSVKGTKISSATRYPASDLSKQVPAADSPQGQQSDKGRFSQPGYTPPVMIERDETKRRFSITAGSEGNGSVSSRTTHGNEEREVLSQLQLDYGDLLTKYALAEVTIDQLRLGAKLNVEVIQSTVGAPVNAELGRTPASLPTSTTGYKDVAAGRLDASFLRRASDLEKKLELLKSSLDTAGRGQSDMKAFLAEYNGLLNQFENLQNDCNTESRPDSIGGRVAEDGSPTGESLLDGRLLELEAKLGLIRSLLLLNQDRTLNESMPSTFVPPQPVVMTSGTAGSSSSAGPGLSSWRQFMDNSVLGPDTGRAASEMTIPGSTAKELKTQGTGSHDDPATMQVHQEMSGTAPSPGTSAIEQHPNRPRSDHAAAAASCTSSDDEMLERKQQQLQLLRRYKMLKKLPRTPERAKEIHQLAEQLQGCLRSTDSSEASHLSSAAEVRPSAVASRVPSDPSAKLTQITGQSSQNDSGLSTPRVPLPHYVSSVRLKLNRFQDSDSGFVPSEGGGQLSPVSGRIVNIGNIRSLQQQQGFSAFDSSLSPGASSLLPFTQPSSLPSSSPDHPGEWNTNGPLDRAASLLEEEQMPVDGLGPESPLLQASGDAYFPSPDGGATARQQSQAAGSSTSLGAGARTVVAGDGEGRLTLPPANSNSGTPISVAAVTTTTTPVGGKAIGAGITEHAASRVLTAADEGRADALSMSGVGPSSNGGSSSSSKTSKRRNASFKALMKEMAQLRDDLRSTMHSSAGYDRSPRMDAHDRWLNSVDDRGAPTNAPGHWLDSSHIVQGGSEVSCGSDNRTPSRGRQAPGDRLSANDPTASIFYHSSAASLPKRLGKEASLDQDAGQYNAAGKGSQRAGTWQAASLVNTDMVHGVTSVSDPSLLLKHGEQPSVSVRPASRQYEAPPHLKDHELDACSDTRNLVHQPPTDLRRVPSARKAQVDFGDSIREASVAKDEDVLEDSLRLRTRPPKHRELRERGDGEMPEKQNSVADRMLKKARGRRVHRQPPPERATVSPKSRSVNLTLSEPAPRDSSRKSHRRGSRHQRTRHRTGPSKGYVTSDSSSYSSDDDHDDARAAAVTTCSSCRGSGVVASKRQQMHAGSVSWPVSDVSPPAALYDSRAPAMFSPHVLCPNLNNGKAYTLVSGNMPSAEPGQFGQETVRVPQDEGQATLTHQAPAYINAARVTMAPVCSACGAVLALERARMSASSRSALPPAAPDSASVPTVAVVPAGVSYSPSAAGQLNSLSQLEPQGQRQVWSGYLSTCVATAGGLGYVTVPVTMTNAGGLRNGVNMSLGPCYPLPQGHRVSERQQRRSSRRPHSRHATTPAYHNDIMAALSSARGSATKLCHMSSRMRALLEDEIGGHQTVFSRPTTL